MKKIFFTCLATLLLIHLNAQSGFQITYEVAYENDVLENATAAQPVENPGKIEYIVELGKNSFFRTSDKNGTYSEYDFEKEMNYRYNSDTLFGIIPVYNVIDYRTMEYKNRIFLMQMLEAGGGAGAFGSRANMESIFGLEDTENNIRDAILKKTDGTSTTYSYEENELVKIDYSGIKIPKKYLSAYSKFLIYSTEIHPSIQEDIIETGLVPQYIQYHYTNVASKITKTYSLKGAVKIKTLSPTANLNTLVANQRSTSKMDGLIDSMIYASSVTNTPQLDSNFYFQESEKLLENNENLSSLLCLFEYLLSSGNQPVKQIQKVIPKKDTDTTLAVFLYCLNTPRSKEDAEDKVNKLNGLIKLDVKYGHILNIFAANYSTRDNQTLAISYFYAALSQQPKITGAWHDLGNIFANQYQYEDAWRCYEIMFRLNPDHPFVKAIEKRKEELMKENPTYFGVK